MWSKRLHHYFVERMKARPKNKGDLREYELMVTEKTARKREGVQRVLHTLRQLLVKAPLPHLSFLKRTLIYHCDL